MTEKYRNKVECVYIDPPYNSPSTEILYKNDYKHSCWASLISCRIAASRPLFGDGVYVLAIDENEQERLGLVLNQSFLGTFKKTCVCIRHNPRGIQGRNFSYCHDFAYFLYPTDTKKYIGERPLEEPDDRTLRDSGLESDRTDARNCFYPFLVKSGKIVGIGDVPSDDFHPSAANEKTDAGATAIWPIDSRKDEKKWRYARQTVETILPKLHVTRANGRLDVHYAKDTGTFRTMWTEAKYDASEYGTKLLQNMFGRKDIDFTYPKSLHTLEDTIRATTRSTEGSMCLDYFAGSGTTAHAIISVNREDGGRRKFILVEIGNYFDTVLLPRVKKVTFAPEWKNGMPARTATAEEAERSPRVVKCVRLESYEDALNNIAFSNGSQQAMRFDDYALTYMLDFETRGSETLLSVDRLSSPFSYKLHVYDDGETKEKPVDLAETFSFLIGLRIKSRRVLYDGDRRYLVYRGMAAEKNTCVIWRDTKDWGQPEFDRDRQFVSQQQLTDGAEVVLVNCDSLIPNAQSLDPVFKRLMFAPVEQ
jgi:adenine-specific DNA-methyltransferase